MKILIITQAFYPGISPRSFRATELAKELARQGDDVTVYAELRDFNYSEFTKLLRQHCRINHQKEDY